MMNTDLDIAANCTEISFLLSRFDFLMVFLIWFL